MRSSDANPTDKRGARRTAPKVSVIIPAFNAEADIEDAIASALNQSLQPHEVIVIDDASRDGTAAILHRIASRDPRVRVITAATNRGPAGARNQGLDAASGDWIALLDADDRFLPERLAILVGRAEQLDADLIADNLLIDGPRGPRPMFPWEQELAQRQLSPEAFLLGNLPDRDDPARSHGFLKPVIRRRFLERRGLAYDSSLRFAEDFAFYLACLLAGARFHLHPQALYRYRSRPGSLTDTHSIADLRRLLDLDRQLETHLGADAAPGLRRALHRHRRTVERRLHWRLFIEAFKARAWQKALSAWAQSPHVFTHISGMLLGEVVKRLRKVWSGPVRS